MRRKMSWLTLVFGALLGITVIGCGGDKPEVDPKEEDPSSIMGGGDGMDMGVGMGPGVKTKKKK